MKCDYQIIIKRGSVCSQGWGWKRQCLSVSLLSTERRGVLSFFFLIYILQFTFIAIPHGIYDPLQEKTFLFEEINGNILQNID